MPGLTHLRPTPLRLLACLALAASGTVAAQGAGNAQQRYENLVNIQVKSCSMFAIYDGHGGADCCNFLKDHLHAYVLNNYNERDVRGSIKTACLKLDADFFKKARSDTHCDTSGSCALVLFVIGSSVLLETTT